MTLAGSVSSIGGVLREAGYLDPARRPLCSQYVLAGALAPGWSTLTGGSEHVGPHVFFYSTTPRLVSLPVHACFFGILFLFALDAALSVA